MMPVDGNLLAPYLKQGTDTACPAGGKTFSTATTWLTFETPVTCKLDPTHTQ